MSYVAKYCTVEDVSRFLQIDISTGTKPSDQDVLKFIEEVEAKMDDGNLGIMSTDVLTKFDVLPQNTYGQNTVSTQDTGIPEADEGVVVVPPFTPIITIFSGTLSRNTASLDDTESWEVLKEGPGDNTDFIVLKQKTRNNRYYGYALFFYGDAPYAGKESLRATWSYGYNINSPILREYAMLKVAEKVILGRLMSGQPMNVATYTAGADLNTYVNVQFEAQLAYIKDRCAEIEKNHWPRKPIPVAFL